ncbi:MAG: type II secretion system protein GspM [Thermodesulfovibrionales bacterium]|nr:type II secretion system protein GspM [Thermodesulfovibrionales bacterium]
MKKNRILIFAIPILIILSIMTFYEYGYLGVVEELNTLRETRVLKEKTLKKYDGIIANIPILEEDINKLKEMKKGLDNRLFQGQTVALAAASVQETVKSIVIANKGNITGERIGKTEDLGNVKVINISMDMTVPDTKALSDILYLIETRMPYLVVKEVDTRVRNFREPRELMVKLDVSALTMGK